MIRNQLVVNASDGKVDDASEGEIGVLPVSIKL